MEYLIVLAVVVSLYFAFKGGLSMSSISGFSVSSSGNSLYIKGNVLSVKINDELKFGDDTLKGSNTNSISQSNSDYSLKMNAGHVKVTGKNINVYVNNKLIE